MALLITKISTKTFTRSYWLPAILGVCLAVPLSSPEWHPRTPAPLPPNLGVPVQAHPPEHPAASLAVQLDTPQTRRNGPDFDTDVPLQTSPFGLADINTLLQHGHTRLELPDGQHLRLVKQRAWQQHNMLAIQFLADGLVGTISSRGDQFFATVATHQEVYRLEGSASGSRIYSHRVLAQRTLPDEKDFIYVPQHTSSVSAPSEPSA